MLTGAVATVWGYLGDKPEIRNSENGRPFVTASLAVNTGKDETSWYRISAFGRMGDRLVQCDKGTGVLISGRLKIETWEGRDGTTRTDVRINANEVHPLVDYEWDKEAYAAAGTARSSGGGSSEFGF